MISRWTLRRIAATTLSAGIVAAAVPAHAGAWIVDVKSGCQVWNPNPQLEESVAWSGSCANGHAEGHGVAQWSKDGNPSETDEGEWRDGRQAGNRHANPGRADVTKGNYLTVSRTGTAY